MDIIGASGHSKVILDTLRLNNKKVSGIWDDNIEIKDFAGYIMSGDIKSCLKSNPILPIIAIGNNKIRKKIDSFFVNVPFGTAIHPDAVIAKDVKVGEGTVVMANCSINTGSSLGRHVIINTNASVDHDCIIGDFVHISPQVGLAGQVEIGEGTHIGIGACVIQCITIGKWCTIGAGAVIINNLPDGVTVVGNPGRIIKSKI
ncbi:MAG: acetyltransferase [Ginsengibacter sp.]